MIELIDIKEMINLIVILMGMKLTLENWQPPIDKHLQAVICVMAGGGFGIFLLGGKDGLINGLVAATLSFWGIKILEEVKEMIKSNNL